MGREEVDEGLIDAAAGLLRDARRVVVFSGAGISTDSGIPDFRGPQGVWTKNPFAEKTSTLVHYLGDAEVRRAAWAERARRAATPARPNGGHLAVAGIADSGRLLAVVTQNVDGLHQDAGVDPGLVVEVHGTSRSAHCRGCGDRGPMEDFVARVNAGEDDPHCLLCGGIVKSDTILFGEMLVEEVISRAFAVAGECDLCLVVGSTLSVSPANEVVVRAASAGAPVVIINAGPTEMDRYAKVLIRGSITPVLTAIVDRAR